MARKRRNAAPIELEEEEEVTGSEQEEN